MPPQPRVVLRYRPCITIGGYCVMIYGDRVDLKGRYQEFRMEAAILKGGCVILIICTKVLVSGQELISSETSVRMIALKPAA